MNAAPDLTGERFGAWTVLERAPSRRRRNGRTEAFFLCRCACGREVEVRAQALRKGASTRCDACGNARRKAVHNFVVSGCGL